jgi:Protein phosphatase 2C
MGRDHDQLAHVVSGPLGASVAGASHARRGTPCQDAFAIERSDGSLVIAVADGLGSAPRADLGAVAAVQAAADAALDHLDREPERAALEGLVAARHALERVGRCGRITDVACTLMVVVSTGRIGIAHIGDGAVVGSHEGRFAVLSPPGASEYVNEVDSLAADDWTDNVRCCAGLDGIDAVAVFTDGMQHAALRKDAGRLSAHEGFFGPLFSFLREAPDDGEQQLVRLLEGPKISEHSDDDKTLVLALVP